MGDAANRGDHVVGKRALLLSPKQLQVIRAQNMARIQALNSADKKPVAIRREIADLVPVYRSIVDQIDAL